MSVQHVFERTLVYIVLSLVFTHTAAQATNLTYPDPKYVFLLREEGGLLSSVPERNMTARIRSTLDSERDVTWEYDLNFGQVFRCAKETKSFLEIPDITTGSASEGFAIAFWFKSRDGNTTDGFSGLMSQVDSNVSISVDNSTVCFGNARDACSKLKEAPQTTDNGWHHITLTTYSKGYQVYVDGVEYGTFPVENARTELDGSSLFLCSTSANGTDILDGNIVDLVVFDQGLQKDEVVMNYNVRNPFRDSINPGMCSDTAIPGLLTQTSCAEGFQCYMLSLNDLVELTNTHDYDGMVGRLGLCVPEIYTNLLPSSLLVPTAHVFYPLTSNKLESFPMSLYSGSSQGASIVPDRLFGQTLYCNGSDKEYVALDPVAYGVGGGFTINFWFKPDQMSPEGFSWLFSHGNNGDNDAFGPNQVQIYLTEYVNQSEYGHVSAYVRDSNDQYKGIDSTGILNGDGTVGSLARKAQGDGYGVFDGTWHMVTLTSQLNGDNGYVLYVDGKKVNELGPDTDVETILGQDFQISGGDMMLITGNVVLCSRGYGDRYPYNGQIAWLSFWEKALFEEQIELLYDSVAQYGVQGSPVSPSMQDDVLLDPGTGGVEVLQYSTSGKKCVFPSLFENKITYGCIQIDDVYKCDVGGGIWEECQDLVLDDATGISKRAQPGQVLDPCLITESPKEAENNSPKGCDQGLICIPTNASTEIGVCDLAPSPIASYHIFNWIHLKGLPQPTILYPLLDGSLMAITHPQYTAEQQNVGWGWDDAFRASVPRCSHALPSRMSMFTGETDGPSMGTTCVWFAAKDPSSDSLYKQVIMSSQDVLPFDVTLTQDDQSRYTMNLEVLDATGDVIPSTTVETNTIIESNGSWHFTCLTAANSSNTAITYELYLDGKREATAQIRSDQIDTQRSSVQGMALCPSFDGSISQYMYYDTHLDEQEMQSLYSIFEESGILEGTTNTSSGKGLSGGDIAGIVIGSIVGAIMLVTGVILLAKKMARNRSTSFKKFQETQGPSGDDFSSREFSYEYDQEEVSRITPEKRNSSMDGHNQIMMNNPVYGLQTPALQSEPNIHEDSEDTSSVSSSYAIHPSNSTSVL